jgi:hypothetical protein
MESMTFIKLKALAMKKNIHCRWSCKREVIDFIMAASGESNKKTKTLPGKEIEKKSNVSRSTIQKYLDSGTNQNEESSGN